VHRRTLVVPFDVSVARTLNRHILKPVEEDAISEDIESENQSKLRDHLLKLSDCSLNVYPLPLSLYFQFFRPAPRHTRRRAIQKRDGPRSFFGH
jgi:hypothetical protein